MGSIVAYHVGGFLPAAPAQNKAEQWNTSAGYTRWNPSGQQVEQRALTSEESVRLAAQDAAQTTTTNEGLLRTKARQALTANATFLAIASPNAAQNAAQAKALTRQVNALIRLLLGALDDVSGT